MNKTKIQLMKEKLYIFLLLVCFLFMVTRTGIFLLRIVHDAYTSQISAFHPEISVCTKVKENWPDQYVQLRNYRSLGVLCEK